MRKVALILAAGLMALAATIAGVLLGPAPDDGAASSHREAPLIADDPAADNTDLYAFRSPDRPDTITIISNVIPGEDPAAGPNWYRFSPAARYNVHIDGNGDARADVTYRFQFRNRAGALFLGNTVQDYTVTRVTPAGPSVVARGTTPPNNIGPRTTPDYRSKAAAAVMTMEGGGLVFAGQREDGFFGDIGAIFDLLALRKGTGNAGGGKDFFAGYAVHALALQIPIAQLDDADHTIGVWTSVERRIVRITTIAEKRRIQVRVGGRLVTRRVPVKRQWATRPWVQVSRLGNPLVNEVIVPTERKDEWNRATPAQDSRFERYYRTPLLAAAINQLYPGVINAPERDRDDLVAVLLTGVPQLNNTGTTLADMLRLNMSIAPSGPVGTGNRLGVFGNDLAGWPNGRRLEDDVIDIAERAVAGKLKGNARADLLGDGVDANDVPHMTSFPYEADPASGFDNTKGQQKP
jgi:Domain of unknown function (DUF4331)